VRATPIPRSDLLLVGDRQGGRCAGKLQAPPGNNPRRDACDRIGLEKGPAEPTNPVTFIRDHHSSRLTPRDPPRTRFRTLCQPFPLAEPWSVSAFCSSPCFSCYRRSLADEPSGVPSHETDLPLTLHLQWVRELPSPRPAWPDQPSMTFDAAPRRWRLSMHSLCLPQ